MMQDNLKSTAARHVKAEDQGDEEALKYAPKNLQVFSTGPIAAEPPAMRVRKNSKLGIQTEKRVLAPPHSWRPVGAYENCHGEEVAPSIVKTCPAEERCIFESRWRHRHLVGQEVWDSVEKDYNRNFTSAVNKDMLEMKYTRGRAKYYDWLVDDEFILSAAWESIEKERYQKILERFFELGGSRNMNLSPSDIEIKLVTDLKLEEDIYLPTFKNMNLRRRRKFGNSGHLERLQKSVDREMDNSHPGVVAEQVFNSDKAPHITPECQQGKNPLVPV